MLWRRFMFVAASGLLLAAATASAQRAGGGNSGRDCATCHLEWTDSFQRPDAVLLIDAPEKAQVAESSMCLGCHDGSIADSRRAVWKEHGHQTGVRPSAGMKVGRDLPLEDGKLACRTCHSAHAATGEGKPGESLADIVFLRVRNDRGQLCQSCHTDHAKGPAAGAHPLGAMPFPMPDDLRAAGAHGGADRKQLVCQSCHAAHGARQDHLLVMSAQSNQLCVSCHSKLQPAAWRPGAAHGHPQNPPLQPAQAQAIEAMGAQVGPDNTLVCLSCHKLHHGQSGKAMLAESLADSRMCLKCHPERSDMANGAHDLRRSAPRERNALGQTAQESGPCGACHTFHHFARKAEPGKADPSGLCTTCHQPGGVAAAHVGQPLSHPIDLPAARVKGSPVATYPSKDNPATATLGCLSCHDPHKAGQQHFLRQQRDDLCASCHGKQATTLAGKHDFSRHPDMKNGRGQFAQRTGKCGFCHVVHDAKGPALWAGTGSAPKSAGDLCAECHRAEGVAGKSPGRFNHPVGVRAAPGAAGSATVSCGSCHDMHADSRQSPKLMRHSGPTSDLCIQCHAEQGRMADGPHDPRKAARPWPVAGTVKPGAQPDLCMSCHQVHSNRETHKLYAFAPAAATVAADGACVACHANHDWSPRQGPVKPGAMAHPQLIAAASPLRAAAERLPLHKADGGDMIACKTCHNPHSPPRNRSLLRIADSAPRQEVCFTCHQGSRSVEQSMHAAQFVDPGHKNARTCGPCHATHAIEGSTSSHLWAAPAGAADRPAAERYCTGCHGPGGSAKQPRLVQHPPAAIKDVRAAASAPASGPVAATSSIVLDNGQITCATCHLPHGKPEGPGRALDLSQPIGVLQLRATKPMMRPNVDRDLCAKCHGLDSTRVYLYFHNPQKREGIKRFTGN